MDGETVAESRPQPDPTLMDGAPAGDAPAGGLQLGEDGLPIPVDENKEEEIIPPEILLDMQNLWSVFDINKQYGVEMKHLRTIMRALDFDLSPEELVVVQK